MEKCRVFSSLALYRSNLGLLQKSYETLLKLNNLVNKDKPFNIDDPEFQKHLNLGDAPAVVLLDTIRILPLEYDFSENEEVFGNI